MHQGGYEKTSLSILKIITIRANAVASAFFTGQAPNEFRYRRVGAKAESLQLFLSNRGAMAATQALKSDTLHTQLRRFVPDAMLADWANARTAATTRQRVRNRSLLCMLAARYPLDFGCNTSQPR